MTNSHNNCPSLCKKELTSIYTSEISKDLQKHVELCKVKLESMKQENDSYSQNLDMNVDAANFNDTDLNYISAKIVKIETMNSESHTDLEEAYGMHEESLVNYDNIIKNEYSTSNNMFHSLVKTEDDLEKDNNMINNIIVNDNSSSSSDLAQVNWFEVPADNFTTEKMVTSTDATKIGSDEYPATIKVKLERVEDEDSIEGNSSMLHTDYLKNGLEGHSIFGGDYPEPESRPDHNLLSKMVTITETNGSTGHLTVQRQNQMTDDDSCQSNVRLKGTKLVLVDASTCERCNHKTTDPRHIECLIVTRPGAKPYSCDVCQKAFKYKNKLVTHLRIHIGDKPFKCDVCSKSFILKNKLKVHSRIHSNIKPYVCHVCDKAFFEGRSLKYHLSTHTEDKPFPCEVCDKSFTYSSGLQRHMKIHSGDRPFPCDVCKKTFKQKCNLERHLRVHSGEKPYPCHICKKNFIESGHLQIHLRIHSGEKPFACDVCDKRFTIKNGLQRHMRIHTGDRPYGCKLCSKTFNEKSNFLKHERICNKKPYHRKLMKLIPEIIYLTQNKS